MLSKMTGQKRPSRLLPCPVKTSCPVSAAGIYAAFRGDHNRGDHIEDQTAEDGGEQADRRPAQTDQSGIDVKIFRDSAATPQTILKGPSVRYSLFLSIADTLPFPSAFTRANSLNRTIIAQRE